MTETVSRSYFIQSDIEEIIDRLGGDGKMFYGASVVVSGGAGFIGRYVTESLKRLGAERIVVLDNLVTAGPLGEAFVKSVKDDPVVRYLHLNVSREWKWGYDIPITHVIHAAGIASPYYYHKYPLETLSVATEGTRHLLDLARAKYACFLFCSSSEVYGNPPADQIPTPETYRGSIGGGGPRLVYAEGKRCGEGLCRVYHGAFGLPVVIVRIFNTYGTGMSEHDGRVMPTFASRLKAGKPLQVYAPGTQTRTFGYVTDTITGCLQALAWGKTGEVYNIGSANEEVSIIELAELMGQTAARKPEIEIVPCPHEDSGEEPQRRCPSIEKARKDFGFNPIVTLEEGLGRFVKWADEHYRGDG